MSESAKERNARADKALSDARRAEIERLIASGPISEDGSDWPPATPTTPASQDGAPQPKAKPPHGVLIMRQPRLDSMTCRVQHERDGSLDADIAASLRARIAAGGDTDLTIFSACHRTNKLVAVYLAEFGILQLRCGEAGCLAPLMQIEVAP